MLAYNQLIQVPPGGLNLPLTSWQYCKLNSQYGRILPNIKGAIIPDIRLVLSSPAVHLCMLMGTLVDRLSSDVTRVSPLRSSHMKYCTVDWRLEYTMDLV